MNPMPSSNPDLYYRFLAERGLRPRGRYPLVVIAIVALLAEFLFAYNH
jgi:hypothetical protein